METLDYRAPIRGIAKMILKLLTQLAAMFAKQIKDLELRLMATGILEGAGQAVEVLSDADPNDREQLRAILNQLINRPEFSNSAKAELMTQIAKLSNEQVRATLAIINENTIPIADLLTDENEDNSEQIREYLVVQLQSPDGIAFFNNLLAIILPKLYADTLTLIIVQALIAFLEEDSEADEDKQAVIMRLRATAQAYDMAA
jgi:hypothetical protein